MTERTPYIVLVHGPAGSGKTTLTWKFTEWIRRHEGSEAAAVNLDAAVLNLPYEPVFDIREYVTATEIMRKYNLGPNGAILRAIEEIEKYIPHLESALDERSYEYVLLDTPGIMEVFVGRETGRRIVDLLTRKYVVVGIFVMDASSVTKASEYIYFKSLFVLSGLKLGIISVPVWSKVNLATKAFKESVSANLEGLVRKLNEEGGLYTEVATSLAELVDKLGHAVRAIKIDSLEGRGFSELYDALHEVFCACGDLT